MARRDDGAKGRWGAKQIFAIVPPGDALDPPSGCHVFESAKPSDAAQNHKAVRISWALDQEQFRSLRKMDAMRSLLALLDEFLEPFARPLRDGNYEVI